MPSEFFWNDAPLRAAAAAAYRLGLVESAAFARSKARWRHVAASISPAPNGVAVGSPDAALLEDGAHPHTIESSGKVAKFKTGGFATGPISHPGFKGSPFMGPTKDAWPSIFTSAARRTFPKV